MDQNIMHQITQTDENDTIQSTNINSNRSLSTDKLLIFGFLKCILNDTTVAPECIIQLIAKYLNYTYLYWFINSGNISIDCKSITKTVASIYKHYAYHTRTITEGIHEWKLKINKCLVPYRKKTRHGINICLSSNNDWLKRSSNWYCYRSDGKTICSPGDYQSSGIPSFGTDDIITVHLNLVKSIIFFSRGYSKFGYSNIDADEYRLNVTLLALNDSVTLLSYKNIVDLDMVYDDVLLRDAQDIAIQVRNRRSRRSMFR
eukprot:552916_1